MRMLSCALAGLLSLTVGLALGSSTHRWEELPAPPPMPKARQSGKAPVNGIDMYYAVYGSGEPILLIHGGLGHADIWAAEIEDLARDHMVIVADSRGHGRSTRTAAPYSYDLMASDYLALLDRLKVDKAALVGWSDGAIIGLDIAMKHPERLTRLFAHAANSKVEGVKPDMLQTMTFRAYVDRSGSDYRRLSPTPDQYEDFVREISAMWASQPNWPDADLARITVPTAIVLGDHDEAISRDHTEYLATTIPGAKLIILSSVGHFAMLQDPAGYAKAVRDFLAK